MQIKTFTGGIFDTNCFLIEHAGQATLVDAPQESADWLARQGVKLDLLLITHGHIDHILDAARIQREHDCQVGYHPETTPMLTEPNFFRQFGFNLKSEPVQADMLIDATPSVVLGGIEFEVLLVPGHCPGSLCFFAKTERVLFGGDVLFNSGVGRWDLPGGDEKLLFHGIKTKLFPLGDDVRVLSGHGPATTIGDERRTNPFLT